MIFRRFALLASLILLILVGCTMVEPTAVPSIPTAIVTAVATPTLASTQPNGTAVPTPTPTLPPPTATSAPLSASVPDANTEDLLALVQAGLPENAFDGLVVLPLYAPESERPLWAIHSTGFRNFDLDPVPSHFVAIYTYENGGWRQLAWQNLDGGSGEVIASPDILAEGTVTQVGIDPAYIWLVVDGYVGAHGGAFQLLRFDDRSVSPTLQIEVTGGSASPGVGYLEELNGDNTPELILRQHDAYVFCYACGVRYLIFQVFTWDAANQRLTEVSIQPMLMGQQGHPARQPTNRAVALADAGLWADALAQIEEAQRSAAETAEPTDTFTLEWDAALIRLYYDAWQAELNHSPYPLLTRVFFGDYAGALDIMRPYSHDQIFNANTPLIQDTVAEGYDQWVADYLLRQTNAAITARPDLAAAYYLRAWAAFLLNPADPQIEQDLATAASLDPDEPLFMTATVPEPIRIQFAPGTISAAVSGEVAANQTVDYILRAMAGQTMDVVIASPTNNVLLTIVGEDGIPLTNGLMSGAMAWHGTLPATQDYILRAIGTFDATSYTMTVTIE